jgi:flagella basal body P-ring formation protein FlgA
MKKQHLITFFGLLLSGTLQANELRLVDQVSVRAPTITLGEIAVIEIDDPALHKQVSNLVVGKTPSIGKSRNVSAYNIRSALARAGVSDMEIFGSSSKVRTETETISGETLTTRIREWIDEHIDSTKEIKIQFLRGSKRWEIPAGNNTELSIEANQHKLAGATTFTVTAVSDDQLLATRRVRSKITLFQESAVMVRPVRRGLPIGLEDIELRRIEVTKSTGMEVAHLESVIGLIAKRNLPVGRAVTSGDYERPVIIKRGSNNRILVVNGEVRMTLTGAEALGNGKKGEVVLFNHPVAGGGTLRAQVVKRGLAVMKMQ